MNAIERYFEWKMGMYDVLWLIICVEKAVDQRNQKAKIRRYDEHQPIQRSNCPNVKTYESKN